MYCCEQGDYDLVITDYTRAKSLFWVTEVQAFKKGTAYLVSVRKEINNKQQKKMNLHKKLGDSKSMKAVW